MTSLMTGNLAMAKLLIDHGANVNAADGSMYTPLHFAAGGNTDKDYKAVELLVQTGANFNAEDRFRDRPLDHATDPRSNFIEQSFKFNNYSSFSQRLKLLIFVAKKS